MKLQRYLQCNQSQRKWLYHHMRKTSLIYEECIKELRKSYQSIRREKAYSRLSVQDKTAYLQRRRLYEAACI